MMKKVDKPYIWQMIKEAIENLNGKATYSELKEWILNNYNNVNENSLNASIIVCTVNHPSRIHYPENKKPRIANSKYDFLYSIGRGSVIKYDTEEHGIWEIKENEYGNLEVGQILSDENLEKDYKDNESNYLFPGESHLRDFLVKI